MSLIDTVKERKLGQWGLAYLGGAFLVWQLGDAFGERWGLTDARGRALDIALVVGFFVTLVLAWYHGELGRQRVSGPELLILAALLGVGGLGVLALAPAASDQADSEQSETVFRGFTGMPSIAVMPFDNRSRDTADSYFTAGVASELRMALSRLPGLKVISDLSVEAYADSNLTASHVGAQLDARYLLDGDVTRAAHRVRINVQLIDTQGESLLWSESYDEELSVESLFEVQSQVVERVAGELAVEISSEEQLREARLRTDNDEAYDLYLRAKAESNVERTIDLLERAVGLDPEFLVAHALLSRMQSFVYQYFDRTPARARKARESADRAMALDSGHPVALLTLGIYYYRVERNYEQGIQWLQAGAGTLHSDYIYHSMLGFLQRRSGRWERSIASLTAASELNPRAPAVRREQALTYMHLHRFADAERWFAAVDSIRPDWAESAFQYNSFYSRIELMRDGMPGPRTARMMELDPQSPRYRIRISLERGQWAEALEALEEAPDTIQQQIFWVPSDLYRGVALAGLDRGAEATEAFGRAVAFLEDATQDLPDDPRRWAALGMAYAAVGRAEDAIDAGARAVALRSREMDTIEGPNYLFDLAVTYTWLGAHDLAIETIDELLGHPSLFTSTRLENSAWLAPLHDDPDFQAVLEEHRGRVF